MKLERCHYCRAEIPDGERETHDRECGARTWWLNNYGHLRTAESPARVLSKCNFCGWEFEAGELADHRARCGQRRWMLLNFEHEGAPPERVVRPAPLPIPREPATGMFAKLFGGRDQKQRSDQVRWSFNTLNSIRDDETYLMCHPGALAIERMWTMIVAPRSTEAKRVAELALSIVMRGLKELVSLTQAIEADLDQLQALSPGKLARDLTYLEDTGSNEAEAAKKRALLSTCDELESDVASRRSRVAELSRGLRDLQRDLERAIEQRNDFDVEQAIKTRMKELIHRLSEPLPRRALPVRRARPKPIDRAIELPPETPAPDPRQAPTVEGRARVEAPIELGLELVGLEATPSAGVLIDQATFQRLAPETLTFSKVKTIGNYRVIGLLGTGGMGVVYEARSPSGRRVALKTVRLSEDTRWDDIHMRRFQRECRILQTIDHPGCVKLLDVGEEDGEVYVVLALVDGVPLASVLRERALKLEEVIGLGAELAAALSYLHQRGIVHRDLKPGNVLIQRDGHSVITDFGISRAADDTRITEAGDVIGTPGYVAPEVVTGGEIGAASDQWALGRLLLRAAAGPRSKGSEAERRATFRERLEAGTLVDWSELPASEEWVGLRQVLERMLDGRPEKRFEHIDDVRRALLALGRFPQLPPGAILSDTV